MFWVLVRVNLFSKTTLWCWCCFVLQTLALLRSCVSIWSVRSGWCWAQGQMKSVPCVWIPCGSRSSHTAPMSSAGPASVRSSTPSRSEQSTFLWSIVSLLFQCCFWLIKVIVQLVVNFPSANIQCLKFASLVLALELISVYLHSTKTKQGKQ